MCHLQLSQAMGTVAWSWCSRKWWPAAINHLNFVQREVMGKSQMGKSNTEDVVPGMCSLGDTGGR